MRDKLASLVSRNTILLLAITTLMIACVSDQPVDHTVHEKLADCAKIADRSERTRCIDAANR